MKSLCLTCKVKCKECFDKDTTVYECDFYIKKGKNDDKRINEKKPRNGG